MSAIAKPDKRREEYICTLCNMSLVVDVYNRLHVRDELIFCPSCHRILYIPDDLPPEAAIGNTAPKPKKEKVPKAASAPRARKSDALNEAGQPSLVNVLATKLDGVLTDSQGESVKGAMDADQTPLEIQVWIDDKMHGVYKGKSADSLERIIRFRLQEAGLAHRVRATDKTGERSSSEALAASETPSEGSPISAGEMPAGEIAADEMLTSNSQSQNSEQSAQSPRATN